jgi:glucose-6-phosphate 1-epimerase
VTIIDAGEKRRIVVAKTGSETTVVWNPWPNLGNVEPDGWRRFVCVEAGNAAETRVTVVPGAEHVLGTIISFEVID